MMQKNNSVKTAENIYATTVQWKETKYKPKQVKNQSMNWI